MLECADGFKAPLQSTTTSPITLFPAQRGLYIDSAYLKKWRDIFLQKDDVFGDKFLRGIVFTVSKDEVHITSDAKDCFRAWNVDEVHYEPNANLPPGPYYSKAGRLHEVWQIHEDPNLAFVTAAWRAYGQDESVHRDLSGNVI